MMRKTINFQGIPASLVLAVPFVAAVLSAMRWRRHQQP